MQLPDPARFHECSPNHSFGHCLTFIVPIAEVNGEQMEALRFFVTTRRIHEFEANKALRYNHLMSKITEWWQSYRIDERKSITQSVSGQIKSILTIVRLTTFYLPPFTGINKIWERRRVCM